MTPAPVPHGPDPKIELHVHLEGTVRPRELMDIATRNGVGLPADTVEELEQLYVFRDFEHFIELWMMTTHAIRTEADFREIVVAYAHEAAAHGAVYLEGIFTPAERVMGGLSWDEVFTGFCDGIEQAHEETGVIVRLTPDIPRGFPLDAAMETALLLDQVPRPRRRRARARWARGAEPTRAVRARVPAGPRRGSRLGAARG